MHPSVGFSDTSQFNFKTAVKGIGLTAIIPPTALLLSTKYCAAYGDLASSAVGGPGVAPLYVDGTRQGLSIPWTRVKWVQGSNAVAFTVPVQSQYIMFEVANIGPTNLTNVTVNVWPKVN
jgi:hypothetical protein